MSASLYFHVILRCNGDDCGAFFHGSPMERRKHVRERAARLGWRYTRSKAGRDYDEDHCPRHSAARPALITVERT